MRIVAAAALLGFSTASLAGVVMQMQDKDLQDPQAKPGTQTFYFQNGAFRMEQSDEGDVSLYRDQAMYMIDTEKRSYRKIDKAQMDQLGDQLAGMRAKLDAQMAKMPPEQRAAMEQAMGKMGGAAKSKAPVYTVRDTGRSDSAAGYACRFYEIASNGKKENEVCTTPPGAFPGGGELLKAMRDLGTFLANMTKGLAGGGGSSTMNGYWAQLQQLNGVPIITRDYDSQGKLDGETRLVAVKSQTLPAALFAVPAGFAEKKLPNMGSVGDDDDDDDN